MFKLAIEFLKRHGARLLGLGLGMSGRDLDTIEATAPLTYRAVWDGFATDVQFNPSAVYAPALTVMHLTVVGAYFFGDQTSPAVPLIAFGGIILYTFLSAVGCPGTFDESRSVPMVYALLLGVSAVVAETSWQLSRFRTAASESLVRAILMFGIPVGLAALVLIGGIVVRSGRTTGSRRRWAAGPFALIGLGCSAVFSIDFSPAPALLAVASFGAAYAATRRRPRLTA